MKRRYSRVFQDEQQVNKNLICPICHDIFNNPVRSTCGHTFCKDCIKQWAKLKQTCPLCRKLINQQFFQKDIIPHKMVQELSVQCSNKECDWKGSLENLKTHLKHCKLYLKQTLKEDQKVEEILSDSEETPSPLEINALNQLGQQPNQIFQATSLQNQFNYSPFLGGPVMNNNAPYMVNFPQQMRFPFPHLPYIPNYFQIPFNTIQQNLQPNNQNQNNQISNNPQPNNSLFNQQQQFFNQILQQQNTQIPQHLNTNQQQNNQNTQTQMGLQIIPYAYQFQQFENNQPNSQQRNNENNLIPPQFQQQQNLFFNPYFINPNLNCTQLGMRNQQINNNLQQIV